MERNWWIYIIILLLISIVPAQAQTGVVSNNRFLQKVNPTIDRALVDGGSSLNHPEAQRLARQMVDLGIWESCNLWVHPGLMKTFTSGSDVLISNAYDLSGDERDMGVFPPVANTEPYYEDLGGISVIRMRNPAFNVNKCLFVNSSVIPINDDYSIILWGNGGSGSMFDVLGTSFWSITLVRNFYYFVTGSTLRQIAITDSVANIWQMYSITRSGNNYRVRLFNENGNYLYTLTQSGSIRGSVSTFIGARKTDNQNTISNVFTGYIGEVRTFTTALTDDQIDAIFNETKGYYGL